MTLPPARLTIGYHPSLQERVYKQLREAIVSGSLTPGQRLVETSLAGQLGVSRSPVREAIRRLEQDGLVVFTPRRGVSVGKPSMADVEDVYTIRGVLEALAARLAARHRTARQLEQMRRLLDRMNRCVVTSDTAGMALADEEFHRLVVEAAGNQKLEDIVATLLDTIRRVRLTVLAVPNWSATALENHLGILAGLEAQDEDRVAELVSSHIERAKQRMLALLVARPELAADKGREKIGNHTRRR